MYRIRCLTLFDITQTGVMNRSKPTEMDIDSWIHRRNTQCNFDTLLQVISLRSQPEVVKLPIKVKMTEEDFEKFGFLYTREDSYCWKFEFEVQHASVFNNSISTMGELYKDCSGVPMIQCNDQHTQCPKFLDTSVELQNIHFEVL
jgi:hypothetical protein